MHMHRNFRRRFELFIVTISVLLILDTLYRNAFEAGRNMVSKSKVRQIFNSNSAVRSAILLSYQRSGSSFTSALFNQNPDAFFMFEPIDGVYCAMYGTSGGWNVPTDIFNHINGSFRMIPEYEKEAVSEVITNILKCDMEALPTEILMHQFIFAWLPRQKSLESFAKCRRKLENKEKINLGQCRSNIKKYCPIRFGTDTVKQSICKTLIWDVRSNHSDYTMTNWHHVVNQTFMRQQKLFNEPIQTVLDSFQKYHNCIHHLTKRLRKCLIQLHTVCNQSKIRSIKTVRLTMDTIDILLKKKSDIQIFHLIRDPRAVALSRLKQPSFRGKQSGNDISKEAYLYCERAFKDIVIRKTLAKVYPDKLHQIIYDDFVSNPLQKVTDLYNSMHLVTPQSILGWVKDHTTNKKNSTAIASSWMKNVTYDVVLNINRKCKDFFEQSTYHWL